LGRKRGEKTVWSERELFGDGGPKISLPLLFLQKNVVEEFIMGRGEGRAGKKDNY